MKTKTVSVPLPRIEGVELKNATVDLEKGVVIAEYGQEEVKKDISETVMNAYSARAYLDIDILDDTFDDKLNALTQLITLAEAWNYFDEFKPDWGSREQGKWHPVFCLRNGKIEFLDTAFVGLVLNPHTSSFSFKTPGRAEQFGKQFIDLFRIILMN